MKTAFITGANSDIGLSIASMLSEKGWNLILSEQASEIPELKEKIKHKKSIKTIELDLNDDESVQSVKERIDRDIGKIDVLINVAGINILQKFLDLERENLEKVVRVNAMNPLLLTQHIVKKMIAHGTGNIIFIGSQHGMVANYDRVPYSLSKAMLLQMTKSIALELSSFGIRVNCVSPTFVLTSKNDSMLNHPLLLKEALSEIPLKRYALPEDIANAVWFLVSEESSMVTGHNLVVDGGWTIK